MTAWSGSSTLHRNDMYAAFLELLMIRDSKTWPDFGLPGMVDIFPLALQTL
jgi:hypothetical protein